MATGGILDRIGRTARQAFAVALLAAFVPDAAAEPATRVCRQLEAQLAALPAGGRASPAQVKRYDDAIERQRDQIARARAQARRAGCGFAVMGGAVAFCGEINATLARMDKNLSELQRKRAQLAGRGGRQERARIMAALDVNGCRAPKRTLPPPVDGGAREQAVIDGRSGLRIGGLSGSYRTMCVRTCDGYYFPISWSVSQGAFERDSKACEAMCPGTQVELHYHRVSGEDSEDMVSAVTGLPYREMTNAFLYRKPGASVPPACGCGAAAQEARGFQTIGGDYDGNEPTFAPDAGPAEEKEAVTAAIPLPSVRPDAAEDPETLSTREGGLDAAGLKKLATPPAKPAATGANDTARPGERQVRVVGPAFLPGLEEAIDLQAPAPARGR